MHDNTLTWPEVVARLQDAAFFSWFARQSPSVGYQGQYTFLGTFPGYSTPC